MAKKLILLFFILSFILSFLPRFSIAQITLRRGSLIRTNTSGTIYYLDQNNIRHPFPNEKIYKSWSLDFSQIIIVSDELIKTYPLGKNITYRPGTKLIKIPSDPKVYALEPPNYLRWIKSEEIAIKLYGPNWAKLVDDLPETLWGDYNLGNEINEPIHPTGTLIKYSWDPNIYLVEGGKKRLVSLKAINENMFDMNFVITLNTLEISYESINQLNEKESYYSDPIAYIPKTQIITKPEEKDIIKPLPNINISSSLTDEINVYENRTDYVELMNLKIENISDIDITISSIKFYQVETGKNQDMDDPQLVFSENGVSYKGSFGTSENKDWIYFDLGVVVGAKKTAHLTFKSRLISPDKIIRLKIADGNYLIIPQKIILNANFPLYTRKVNILRRPSIIPSFNLISTTLEKNKYNFIGYLNLNNCLGGKIIFNNIIFTAQEQDITSAVWALKLNDRLIYRSGNQYIYGSTLTNCDLLIYVILNNDLIITGPIPKIKLQLISISGTYNDGASAMITNLPLTSQDLNIIP